MKNRKLKLLAFSCALALGIPTIGAVHAQTGTVNATLTTSSAITVTAGNDMDFGTWLILLGNDDVNNTLVMNAQTGAITDGNSAGVDTTDDSTRVLITAGTGAGSLTVQTPAAATVNMSGVITDFTDGDIVMTLPTVSVNAAAETALSTNPAAPTSFSATGGADDTLTFGATVTFTDTPPDAAHTASLAVTFSY